MADVPANAKPLRGLYVKLKHGAAVRDRRVYRLVGRMRQLCPWLVASDMPAMRAWAQLEILADVIYGRLREEGIETLAGEPKKLLAEFRALRSAQATLARELGLLPAARRKLINERTAFESISIAAAEEVMPDAGET